MCRNNLQDVISLCGGPANVLSPTCNSHLINSSSDEVQEKSLQAGFLGLFELISN